MTIVAHRHPFVIGVDTHTRNHVYAIINTTTGALEATRSFPTTTNGMNRALEWAGRRTGTDLDALWVVEGAGSYGAHLTHLTTGAGYTVVEAPRMDPKARFGAGKDDTLDANQIARTAMGQPLRNLRHPRQDEGVRKALAILLGARESMTTRRTEMSNELTALVHTTHLGIDARRPLTKTQIKQIATWRTRTEDLATATARKVATDLTKQILTLEVDLTDSHTQIAALVQATPAAALVDEPGIGALSAARAFVAYSHPRRLSSEAAFASLAGINPIPASSGNTTRHRLNRGADRALNSALHIIALTRIRSDPRTIAYVEKRRAEGKTDREIRRILKRYIARSIYRTLTKNST